MYSHSNEISVGPDPGGPCKRDYEAEMARAVKHLEVVSDAVAALQKLFDFSGLPHRDKERAYILALFGDLTLKKNQLQNTIERLVKEIEKN